MSSLLGEWVRYLDFLPKNIRDEVRRAKEEILSMNLFPKPDSRLIVRLRSKSRYKDIYRIVIASKYRYVYRVEGTTIYSRYVRLRTSKTYEDIP